jgi:hypothetical protein
MTFISHIPSPPLNFYINSFYYPNESLPLPREKILPLPGLDLKINFGGDFQVYDADQRYLLKRMDSNIEDAVFVIMPVIVSVYF